MAFYNQMTPGPGILPALPVHLNHLAGTTVLPEVHHPVPEAVEVVAAVLLPDHSPAGAVIKNLQLV